MFANSCDYTPSSIISAAASATPTINSGVTQESALSSITQLSSSESSATSTSGNSSVTTTTSSTSSDSSEVSSSSSFNDKLIAAGINPVEPASYIDSMSNTDSQTSNPTIARTSRFVRAESNEDAILAQSEDTTPVFESTIKQTNEEEVTFMNKLKFSILGLIGLIIAVPIYLFSASYAMSWFSPEDRPQNPVHQSERVSASLASILYLGISLVIYCNIIHTLCCI
ncbi:hypothetical protein H7R52_05200 [Weissella confusa]|uniref:Uncharacterized protein n=1 Tax=Weissella confusa TaxID=1583 RepID=A0A923SMT2_WEICO|nr:hypothetical protein [Weissella confusa]